MFEGCVNLVGGNGTRYEKSNREGCHYANIDDLFAYGLGYFTKKE